MGKSLLPEGRVTCLGAARNQQSCAIRTRPALRVLYKKNLMLGADRGLHRMQSDYERTAFDSRPGLQLAAFPLLVFPQF